MAFTDVNNSSHVGTTFYIVRMMAILMSQRISRSIIVVSILLAGIDSAGQSAQEKVAIFVTSAGAVNGLTDPSRDNLDSVKDVTRRLEKIKEVRLVKSPAEAKLVVTITGRERQGKAYIVRSVLKVGSMEFPLETQDTQGFDYAAIAIGTQIRDWVRANRGTLNASTR